MSTILTDGNKTVKLTMHEWDEVNSRYLPAFEHDFFTSETWTRLKVPYP